ncbi:MAG: hypothetical protein J6Z35_04305 [Lachnospiraceae bacterium]|nr:hypothetical protein [Lachnospiraceae bacterium]
MRLLISNAFYGLLLMHAKIGISDEHETAWTEDGEKLVYNPQFIMSVSDRELDYSMMHLVLHLALNHTERASGYDKEKFDEAADIVANSNILRNCGGDIGAIALSDYGGVQPHLAPDGSEGWQHSADELYSLLNKSGQDKGDPDNEKKNGQDEGDPDNEKKSGDTGWDAHVESEGSGEKDEEDDEWKGYILQAAKIVAMQRTITEAPLCGTVPAFAERYIEELKKPQTDWRTILNEYVQEDIVDYSFTPPDRRFGESDFFLPDFNEKDEKIMKILFMIETSASMSD